MFKYCPFCGQKLIQPAGSMVFKYCPECGQNLDAVNSVNTKSEATGFQPTKSKEEQKDMQIAIHEEKDIGIDAEEFFTKLKSKLTKTNSPQAVSLETAEVNASENSFYSIIIKSCENKEKLAHALKNIFTRSFLAIRMALDNMPGILVYKGKVSDMTPIVTVLRSQNAAFSIVSGHFNFKVSLSSIFPDFNSLFPEVQTLIKAMPLNMWLGDTILGVFPDVYQDSLGRENKGALIISDQALYFVYKHDDSREFGAWVMPYSAIEQLFLEEGCEYDGLVVSFKDGRDEEMFVIADELILSESYEVGRKAMKSQQNSVVIQAVCSKCSHAEYHTPYDAAADKKCLNCAVDYEKTLVQNN